MLQYKLPLIVIVAPWKLYSEQTIRGQKSKVLFWETYYVQVTWNCAFTMGKRYFSSITWFNLCRIALKVTKWIDKLGSGISKMDHWSCDTAHAHGPFQVMVMRLHWVTHNPGMHNRWISYKRLRHVFTAYAQKWLFSSFRSKIWPCHSLLRPRFPIRRVYFHYRMMLAYYIWCFCAQFSFDLVTLTFDHGGVQWISFIYLTLTISPKLCPLIGNRGRWTRRWRQF